RGKYRGRFNYFATVTRRSRKKARNNLRVFSVHSVLPWQVPRTLQLFCHGDTEFTEEKHGITSVYFLCTPCFCGKCRGRLNYFATETRRSRKKARKPPCIFCALRASVASVEGRFNYFATVIRRSRKKA